jgi:hypothetical protein
MFDAVEKGEHTNRSTVGIGLVLLLSGLVLNYVFARQNVGPRTELSLTIAPFFVAATGAALSIVGMARLPLQRALRTALLIAAPITLLYAPLYIGMRFLRTGADLFGECTTVCQTAAASNVVPVSLSVPGQPAVFCSVERRGIFLSYYNRLAIYGVTDPAAQELVLRNLSDYYRATHINPLQVRFFERENWTVRQGKNGVSSGSRGHEHLLRVVNIG